MTRKTTDKKSERKKLADSLQLIIDSSVRRVGVSIHHDLESTAKFLDGNFKGLEVGNLPEYKVAIIAIEKYAHALRQYLTEEFERNQKGR